MKLTELLETSAIRGDRACQRFLFNKVDILPDTHPRINRSAAELLAHRELQEDGWERLDEGGNFLVFATDSKVFKIRKVEHLAFKQTDGESAPDTIAAKIHLKGKCNGSYYYLCDRLDTRTLSAVEEIIPFLFKARDAGYIYWDPRKSNFGYDRDRTLKVTDHEHFVTTGKKHTLTSALKYLFDIHSQETTFPLVAFDDKNTYVAFDPKKSGDAEVKAIKKRLVASLEMVSDIRKDDIEEVRGVPVLRIPATRVTVGTPPEREEISVAKFVRRCFTESAYPPLPDKPRTPPPPPRQP